MMKNARYDLFRNVPGSSPELIAQNLTQGQCKKAVERDARLLSNVLRLSEELILGTEWTAQYHRAA